MTAIAKINSPTQDDVLEVINPHSQGNFLLICEHASKFIPAEFNNLGLDEKAASSHAAWDPGARAVAQEMSKQLDASLVAMCVSRLVYDCNRPPESDGAMPERSEIFDVPGNAGLTEKQRQARVDQYYLPFHQKVSDCIDEQTEGALPPVLITMHSFTPVYNGVERHLDIGVLHDSDSRFADALLESMKGETHYIVARNEPYGPADGVTHTLVKHALPRGLMNVMIEIRNDIIDTTESQLEMAQILSRHVATALTALSSGSS